MSTSPASSRILIRPPTAEDCPAFLALVRASRKLHRGWVTPPATRGAFHQYLERMQTDRHRGFLLCRRSDGAVVGVCNLNEIIRGAAQSAFLGYYAMDPFTGQGYMTEGIRRVLRVAFTRLKLHRLEANIQPENAPSLALVRRCGFCKEGYSPRYLKIGGRWRDHERWALLADAWRDLKSETACS